jgi:amidase
VLDGGRGRFAKCQIDGHVIVEAVDASVGRSATYSPIERRCGEHGPPAASPAADGSRARKKLISVKSRMPSRPSRPRLAATLIATVLLAWPAAGARSIPFDEATIGDINAAFDAGTLTAETLVRMCLARIDAFDRKGPSLHAVITLNPKAIDTARALDAERKTKGRRSPLHGIPVVLKDNYDTADMPTTGGSVLLDGWIPPRDAFIVEKLRGAGAIVLAKVNLSEFASGGTYSSLGGQSHNPHDLTRTPSGSSGGTGVAVAAAYAPIGLGTDTGGSIRGPATANGVVGLKPTHGLLSRSGIIPLALSFDTGGPLARSVYDVAAALGVMTGIDPADPATKKSEGRFQTDYTTALRADALQGARIGVARDFFGADPDVDWVIESAAARMRTAGATLVDVRLPKWLLDVKGEFYTAVRYPEFVAQIAAYLKATGPKYPKTLAEMIERAQQINAPREDGGAPNPSRWTLFKRELESASVPDYQYRAVHDHGLPLVGAIVEGLFDSERLDAIVYPTASRRPAPIAAMATSGTSAASALAASGMSGTDIANLTGFPDLIVPAGFTSDGLPVGVSFLGRAFAEPRLLALGYSFEQLTHARRRPVHTPALQGEVITRP